MIDTQKRGLPSLKPPCGRRANFRARRFAAVWAAKGASRATRFLGKGGGTAIPGVIATRIDPTIVTSLAAQLTGGSVMITGTNGKTSTARLLGAILRAEGVHLIRNQSGSNLSRGLASTLVSHSGLLGNLPTRKRTVGIFEVDEAAVRELLGSVAPGVLVLLNLFRDQLDRYGEVASVARVWEQALGPAPATLHLVVNADDPLVAHVASARPVRPIYFGIDSVAGSPTNREHAGDVKACPRCGGRVEYDVIFLGHLGHYQCSVCGFRRPSPDVVARDVRLDGVNGSTFVLDAGTDRRHVDLPLPGLYNVYNAVAAAAAGRTLGVALATIADALGTATAAFGRMERLRVDGRNVIISLAKNPTGLNQVLRTLLSAGERLRLLVMLSDNIADGRDVSWIWDADVELLRGHVASVIFAGTRPFDMALRFKYAEALEKDTVWEVQQVTEKALARAVELTPLEGTLFIVPTYTALLDVRNALTRLGHAKPYWED